MTPKLYGDGIHDDQPAMQAVIDGKPIEILNDCAHFEGAVLNLHAGTICFIGSCIMTAGKVTLRKIEGANMHLIPD